jgi:hypothetical protein
MRNRYDDFDYGYEPYELHDHGDNRKNRDDIIIFTVSVTLFVSVTVLMTMLLLN